ncbi:Oligo-1,6-glucosidase [Levilactobacillus brevis KB290]|uniref:Oligo-1,6-glucosidase n=1 Tax=Levilactobacillus brevis KB290 TaxID=1001583 RepID=M5AAX8_LEVBR|nr:alpha-glucosidase [Levilactobacillus brevis]BAN05949.1 Oligo-1,6-glucosidase [Levilactobacillus brevis KB290]
MADTQWWQHAVGYQIYPRSFFDSNHDGVGDLPGILTKIDYLQSLGIDFVWLSAFYPSGNVDSGYDVTNYRDVASQYGTLADFDRLVTAFHEAGIKVVIDLALNHTSDQHPWFQAALADPQGPYRDYYLWQPATATVQPNNWQSVFGDSAWTYVADQQAAYLHTFAAEQPDLNWRNPAVRHEMVQIIQWWADRGVDGFRFAGVTHLKKRTDFADVTPATAYYEDVADTVTLLADLKPVLVKNHLLAIGEAGGIDPSTAQRWLDPATGFFDLLLEFDHVHFWEQATPKLPVAALRATLSRWQQSLEGTGWNTLFIENHDLPRAVSYYGNDQGEYRRRSAKALGMLYLLMKGTPFIYQGQELGLPNAGFTKIADYRDLDSRRYYQRQRAAGVAEPQILSQLALRSWDNARTPMPWTHQQYGGFSDHEPWLQMAPGVAQINVERESHDPHAVLPFYQQLIRIKKSVPALRSGRYELIDTGDNQLYVYRRTLNGDNWLVVVNMSDQPATTQNFDLTTSELILTNLPVDAASDDRQIQPWEARLYHWRRLE